MGSENSDDVNIGTYALTKSKKIDSWTFFCSDSYLVFWFWPLFTVSLRNDTRTNRSFQVERPFSWHWFYHWSNAAPYFTCCLVYYSRQQRKRCKNDHDKLIFFQELGNQYIHRLLTLNTIAHWKSMKCFLMICCFISDFNKQIGIKKCI